MSQAYVMVDLSASAVKARAVFKALSEALAPYRDRFVLYEMGYVLVNKRGRNRLTARKDRI